MKNQVVQAIALELFLDVRITTVHLNGDISHEPALGDCMSNRAKARVVTTQHHGLQSLTLDQLAR